MNHRLLVAACAAFLIAGPPISAKERAASNQPLRAINIITGTGISSMPVHLERPASLYAAISKSPDVEIRGAGRFVGIALVHEGRKVVRNGVEVREMPALLVGRYRHCLAAGCDEGRTIGVLLPMASEWDWNEDIVLPAGDYTLYLIADGAPARIELRLHGASGDAVLSPKTPVDTKLSNPQSIPFPTKNAFTATDTVQEQSRFLSFHALWLRGFGPFAGHVESCLYRGRRITPAGAEHAEGIPYCTHAAAAERTVISGSFTSAIVTPYDYGFDFYGAAQPVPAGRWTSTLWYRIAGLVEDGASLAFRLPYPKSQQRTRN